MGTVRFFIDGQKISIDIPSFSGNLGDFHEPDIAEGHPPIKKLISALEGEEDENEPESIEPVSPTPPPVQESEPTPNDILGQPKDLIDIMA